MRIILLSLIYTFFVSSTFAERPNDFREAKRMMPALFAGHQKTIYCQCDFNNKKQVDLKSCGLQEFANNTRARRVEAEHLVAAENFGRHFQCWREKICISSKGKPYRGRKCCQKTSAQFRLMEGELYNLWPADGLVNQLRSNYRFSAPASGERVGDCDFWVDKKARKVTPNDDAKGIVARATLFMSDHYQVPLSKSQTRLMIAWHKMYPASSWEKEWARNVAKIEGYKNQYILDD